MWSNARCRTSVWDKKRDRLPTYSRASALTATPALRRPKSVHEQAFATILMVIGAYPPEARVTTEYLRLLKSIILKPGIGDSYSSQKVIKSNQGCQGRSAAATNGCRVLTRRGSPRRWLSSLRRMTTIRCGAGCTLFAYVISLLSGTVSGFDKFNVERERLAPRRPWHTTPHHRMMLCRPLLQSRTPTP